MERKTLTHIAGLNPISSGGFSSVVLGLTEDEDVILKIINPSEGNINIFDAQKRAEIFEDISKDFSSEKELVSSLSHKNIIKYVDCEWPLFAKLKSKDIELYEDFTKGFISYEFADQTLRSLTEYRRLSIFYAVYIIRQLSRGLSYLHNYVFDRRIIIHGDLKPDNIFIHKYGQVKIGDFGSAKIEFPFLWTKPKSFSSFYMAPEMAQKKLDGSSDIWACGVILLELLLGSQKLRELLKGKCLYEFISSSDSNIIDIFQEADINKDIMRIVFENLLVEHAKRFRNGKQLFNLFSNKAELHSERLRLIIKKVENFEEELDYAIEIDSMIRHRFKNDDSYSPENDLVKLINVLKDLINKFKDNDFDFLYCFYAQSLIFGFECAIQGRTNIEDLENFLINAHTMAYKYLKKAMDLNPQNTYYTYTMSKLAYFDYLFLSKNPDHLNLSVNLLIEAIKNLPRKMYMDTLKERYHEIEEMYLKDITRIDLKFSLNKINDFFLNQFGPNITVEMQKQEKVRIGEKRTYKLELKGIGKIIPTYKDKIYPQLFICDGIPINFKIVEKEGAVTLKRNYIELSSDKNSDTFEVTLSKDILDEFKDIDLLFGPDRRTVKFVLCSSIPSEDATVVKGVIIPYQSDFIDYLFVGKIRPNFTLLSKEDIKCNISISPKELVFNPYEDMSSTILGQSVEVKITPKLKPDIPAAFKVTAEFLELNGEKNQHGKQ